MRDENRRWLKASNTSITCDGWTICRVTSGGGESFELFAPRGQDGLPQFKGKFGTPDEAKTEFDLLTRGAACVK